MYLFGIEENRKKAKLTIKSKIRIHEKNEIKRSMSINEDTKHPIPIMTNNWI